jgi:pectinesterase
MLRLVTRVFLVVALFAFPAVGVGVAQNSGVTLYPANRAAGVNPDTHLVVTFASAAGIGTTGIGKSGQIRIYDADGHRLVDTLDMSIPAGPDPLHRVTPPAGSGIPLAESIPTSPTTTTPAVRVTPADLHSYQLDTIGGLENFHFYPVIVHGNVATIYPHHRVLRYGHRYIVQIDAGVLKSAEGAFAGFAADFNADKAWTFTTKKKAPPANATRVVVAADGSGDFNTVQGAIDFVPDHPAHRVTVFIKDGTYEEIVFFQGKSNLTIRGEDREKVQVGYGNNSAFNPPQPGPNRRCAFSVYDSNDIELENFSVSNYDYGQAEGLLISGSRNIVSHVNILGVGPAFFDHCEIQSIGAFMWVRNTEANHGNVFVDCAFIARERPAASSSAMPEMRALNMPVFARLPNNHGLNYPYAEAVLIHCRLKGIAPEGWGPIEAETANLHLWEFDSTDLDGRPIDTSQRAAASKQLALPGDAVTIANYSKPAFVLGGWTPVVEK